MLCAAVANFTNCITSSLSPHVLPYFLVGFDIFTAKLMKYVEDREIGACLYLSVSLPSTRKNNDDKVQNVGPTGPPGGDTQRRQLTDP